MDANGILSVSAIDKISGRKQAVRITPSTGLSKDEIEKMTMEARHFAENDRRLKEVAELRNRVQGQATVLIRSFAGLGSFLSSEDQEMIKGLIEKTRGLNQEEEDPKVLNDMMAQIERGTATLSKAVFNAPGTSAAGNSKKTEDGK
jgi:molecular chaperone DnaK